MKGEPITPSARRTKNRGEDYHAKDRNGFTSSSINQRCRPRKRNGRARFSPNRIEDLQKILLGYRDNMKVEIESGVAVNRKNRGGPSRTPHLAGRLGLSSLTLTSTLD